jgi:hypothetical protein
MNALRAAGAAGATLAIVLAAASCGGGRKDDATRPATDAAATDGAATGDAPTGEAPTGEAPTEDATPPATGQPAAAPADAGNGSPVSGGPAAAPTEPNHREVVLFFQRAEDDSLGPERRKILLTTSIADQARQILGELAAGPETEGLLPTVPRRTTVLGVYIDRAGTLFVDLSEEFVSMHRGGSSEELATILSIVDSLTYNLPEIRRVRFLVGGEERDTLKNHLDLRSAYLKDMSIVRMEEGG